MKRRLVSRKENSPNAFNYLTAMQETLRDEIRILEGKSGTMAAQMTGLQRDQVEMDSPYNWRLILSFVVLVNHLVIVSIVIVMVCLDQVQLRQKY